MFSNFSVNLSDHEPLQFNAIGQINPYSIYINIVYSGKSHFPSRGVRNNQEPYENIYIDLLRTSTPNFTCKRRSLKIKEKSLLLYFKPNRTEGWQVFCSFMKPISFLLS